MRLTDDQEAEIERLEDLFHGESDRLAAAAEEYDAEVQEAVDAFNSAVADAAEVFEEYITERNRAVGWLKAYLLKVIDEQRTWFGAQPVEFREGTDGQGLLPMAL